MPKGVYSNHKKISLKKRLLKKTDKTNSGCWIFTGSKTGKMGHGEIRRGGSAGKILAHRASYLLFIGEIPKNICVCHKCDVPACVNPSHLFLATREENNKDRDAKNRGAKGEKHGRSKLNKKNVIEIRDNKEQKKVIDLAHKYGVTATTINNIISRRSWKSV